MAKSLIAETGAAESEVAAMPAGGHSVLGQTRQAVEERARTVLAQLQELEGASVAAGEDDEGIRLANEGRAGALESLIAKTEEPKALVNGEIS
jgi:hypothetical protein